MLPASVDEVVWIRGASPVTVTDSCNVEGFICDHFITGDEGLVDDSLNFQTMIGLLNQKSSPISSAVSITFDYEE